MPKLFLGLSGWNWLDILSLVGVAAGTIGSFFARSKRSKFSTDENGLIPVSIFFERAKLKSNHRFLEFWDYLLIAGLIGGIFATWHNILEVVTLNNENLVLQRQIMETSTNVAKIDPLNQPARSATAKVILVTEGTNGLNSLYFEPKKFTGYKLAFADAELYKIGAPTLIAKLILQSCDGSNTVWTLNFGRDDWVFGDHTNITVGEAIKSKIFEIGTPFFKVGTKIVSGEISLKVNDSQIDFPINSHVVGSTDDWKALCKNPTNGIWIFNEQIPFIYP